MIIARERGALRIVRQVDHQEQCRLAAEAWGNGRFARVEHWHALVRAAAVHDEGWRSWERAPRTRADGHPVDLTDLDRHTHVALYRDGIAAAVRSDVRVGLLVSMHGDGLYRSRLGLDGPAPSPDDLAEPGRTFSREQAALQESLRARLGGGAALGAWAWASYRLLQAWDSMCLFLAWRRTEPGSQVTLPCVPRGPRDGHGTDIVVRRVDAVTATCVPFPFAGDAVALPVAARRIPDRSFRDDEDLRDALARSPVETVPFTVVAGDR